jgi:hypothetical protein
MVNHPLFEDHDHIKNIFDVTAGAIGLATVLKWLPDVAALLTIIWTLIRIYDWVERRFSKKAG